MRKFSGSTGSVSRVTVESQALKSNMLGDPSVRVVDVYVPPGHDGQGLPVLVNLVGFTSSGLSQTNWAGFHENLPERLDRLIGERRMPPLSSPFPIASLGSAATNTSTQLPWVPGRTSCCMKCCRQSSSASGVAEPDGAAYSAKSSGGMAQSHIRYAVPTSGGPRPFIPAIRGVLSADMPPVLRTLAGAENSIR